MAFVLSFGCNVWELVPIWYVSLFIVMSSLAGETRDKNKTRINRKSEKERFWVKFQVATFRRWFVMIGWCMDMILCVRLENTFFCIKCDVVAAKTQWNLRERDKQKTDEFRQIQTLVILYKCLITHWSGCRPHLNTHTHTHTQSTQHIQIDEMWLKSE